MELVGISPIETEVKGATPKELDEIKAYFTYRDKKVQFEIVRHRRQQYFQSRNPEKWEERLLDLKSKEVVCLVTEKDGRVLIPAGLAEKLTTKYGARARPTFPYPEGSTLPWARALDKTPWPYQEKAFQALLAARHARVEMGTGLGKSFIIMLLARQLGLKTVVMAPSTQIAEQLYEDFREMLGPKYVGQFFDGKKEPKKRIVIGNAQSLTRVEEGTDAWDLLRATEVFIADESHQCPASTLANVCNGVCAGAPYRFFFSATQMRNDGLDLMLDGITGPTVFSMTVREGVDQGYLAKPVFRMIETTSDREDQSDDANEMTRIHLFYNTRVLKQVADLANLSVEKLGHQVLILIDEVEQFARILPMLHAQNTIGFAHGPLQPTVYYPGQEHLPVEARRVKVKGNLASVPVAFREAKANELVKDFNAGKIKVLVGTSCISTGTDIRAVKTMIYFKGGKSEIEVKQGIGRCTRLCKEIEKTACTVIDFDVTNIPILTRHTKFREEIYDDIYGPVQRTTW